MERRNKKIKMRYVQISTPREECHHSVQQAFINKVVLNF